MISSLPKFESCVGNCVELANKLRANTDHSHDYINGNRGILSKLHELFPDVYVQMYGHTHEQYEKLQHDVRLTIEENRKTARAQFLKELNWL